MGSKTQQIKYIVENMRMQHCNIDNGTQYITLEATFTSYGNHAGNRLQTDIANMDLRVVLLLALRGNITVRQSRVNSAKILNGSM